MIYKKIDDRDKKSYKCLGIKLLNNNISNSMLNYSNNLNKKQYVNTKEIQQNEYNKIVYVFNLFSIFLLI